MHLDHKIPWHLIAPHFSLTPAEQEGNYSLATLELPEQQAVIGHFSRMFLTTIREFSATETTKIDSAPVSGKLFSDNVLYYAERHFGLEPHEDNSALHNPLKPSHQDLEYWKRRAKDPESDYEPCYTTADANLADAAKMLVIVAATADNKTTRREALSALVRLAKEVPLSNLRGLHWGHAFGLDLVVSVALQMYIYLNLIEAVESRAAERVPLLSVDNFLTFLSNHALENYDFPAQNIPHRDFWFSLGVTESWVAGRRNGTLERDMPVIDPLADGSDEVQQKAREGLRKYLKDCFAIFRPYALALLLPPLRHFCASEIMIPAWPTAQVENEAGELSSSTLDGDLRALAHDSINPWIEAYVGSEGDTAVRLVNTGDLSEDNRKSLYTILSYRWGSSNDSARTTSQNLRERLSVIKPHSLPKTIRDAIILTQLMKIRYLWVDALCILQSDRDVGDGKDEEANLDWVRESACMASYYANSVCCIAASNAKDSSEGILSERRIARYGKWYNPPNVFIQSPYTSRRRVPSLLLDRGWCLQEWLISPRVMHWTTHGLVWECSEGFFWEGEAGFKRELRESFPDDPHYWYHRERSHSLFMTVLTEDHEQLLALMVRSEERVDLGQCWMALITQYSHMHLSFSSDKLAAIQGIASLLSRRHGVDYFAGIFRLPVMIHLFWRPVDPQSSSFDCENFPSWSWMSSNGGVYFEMTSTDSSGSFLEKFKPFPSTQHEKDLVRITNKALRFTAPLMKIDGMDLGEPKNPQPERHVGPGAPLLQGWHLVIDLDSVASSASLKSDGYLLFVSHDLLAESCYGLVVQMVEGDGRRNGYQDLPLPSSQPRLLAMLPTATLSRNTTRLARRLGSLRSRVLFDRKKSYQRIGVFSATRTEGCQQEQPDIKKYARQIVLV
ncbi:uncharacterized protein FTJAE_3938 [Fusarium tjaetaba]|uniref:Heterokaryon incompatibility domain-containing protein n=1 Tax=Fusarium tjaetaba TaxID=1567544 RepID=A0A8H5W026_9HYPO|nr:uncharacterized protein FTJAE_3938 [Fusarium tjaetaba]KAF5641866.1 hypothetical protein FTJAE_3938 [Fusarium tjaetaba]